MKKQIKWVCIGFLLLVIVQLMSLYIFKSLGIGGTQTSIYKVKQILAQPQMLIIPIIISPIFEELIFRKLLFRKNMKVPFNYLTGVMSSILFGFVHGEVMLLTVPLIVNGLIYCLVYEKTDKITSSIYLHMLYNVCVFIILYISIR